MAETGNGREKERKKKEILMQIVAYIIITSQPTATPTTCGKKISASLTLSVHYKEGMVSSLMLIDV